MEWAWSAINLRNIAIKQAIRPGVQLLKAPRLFRCRIQLGSPASRAAFDHVPVV